MWQRLIFGRTTVIRPLPVGPFAEQHTIRELQLQVSAAVALEGWVAEPIKAAPRKVLLYFGGRNENVAWAPKLCSHLGHWAIYAFNYRGMGSSGGRPTEAHAKADALQILKEVLRREGQPVELALVGRSLGSSIATWLAAQPQVDRLVLLSPFDSLQALVRHKPLLRPLHWLAHRHFDVVRDAARVTVPTTILLAQFESRVPHSHSHRLAKAFAHLEHMVEIPDTTHKTLPRHSDTVAALASLLQSSAHRLQTTP